MTPSPQRDMRHHHKDRSYDRAPLRRAPDPPAPTKQVSGQEVIAKRRGKIPATLHPTLSPLVAAVDSCTGALCAKAAVVNF